jgi:hypothetical protein
MGRHGDRPSLNFSGFLAGKVSMSQPRKGAPVMDAPHEYPSQVPNGQCVVKLQLIQFFRLKKVHFGSQKCGFSW